MAIANHPQLQRVQAQQQAAAAVPDQVRARLYPQVSALSSGALAEDANTRILAGGLNNPVILNRWGIGASATQLLTDFGRTRTLAESADLRAEAAQQAVAVGRADVVLRVYRAYFGAMRAQAILRVAQQTVKARDLVANQASVLAQNKLKSDLDVTFARVNVEEARLLLSNAVNAVRSSMVDLANAMGFDPGASPDYVLSEEGLPAPLPDVWAEAAEQALANRPELAQARLDREAAAAFVRAENSLQRPTVSAVVTAGVAPLHHSRLQGHYIAGGINVDFPLLTGGMFKARRTEAEARQRAAEAAEKEVRNQVERDVRLAFIGSQNAFERLQLTASLLGQAQQALRLAQARYDLGLSSIVELSQAQLNLTSAEIAQTSAKFDYQAARALLEYQKGVLR
ncbi:protein CyaE [Bryobacterales bacterium F-183]|nr:protein CyaE [Bryobacterales bacterium F-183]